MGDNTTIEWTDATWNPVRGCSIVSKGCTNCYAMRQAHRSHGAGGAYEGLTKLTKGGPVWTGEVRLVPKLLGLPGSWKKPRRIFVNSMSDLFQDGVPDEFIAQVWERMAWNQQHVFQILTKRPARMLDWVSRCGQDAVHYGEREEHEEQLRKHGWPLRNVWLGVSVEDQAAADERIQLLLKTPAAVRWISAEPLLGQINLDDGECSWLTCKQRCNGATEGPCTSFMDLGRCFRGIDWVVAGGESGPGARPMHPDWARSLRDQCAAFSVPFFFKQWGSHLPGEYNPHAGDVSIRWQDGRTEWYGDHQDIKYGDSWFGEPSIIAWPTSKASAGRQLDGHTHDEYPVTGDSAR